MVWAEVSKTEEVSGEAERPVVLVVEDDDGGDYGGGGILVWHSLIY
jgi:hypothetical protein